jgi:hypothetical protein
MVLCQFLGMDPRTVFEASKKYANREADLFRFIFSIRFLVHALENELKERATTLKVVSLIFTVEGIAPSSLLPNRVRLKRFLVLYLSRQEKITLLTGFTFTGGHALGQHSASRRHLMFDGIPKGNAFLRTTDCSTCAHTVCSCRGWLAAQPVDVIDDYTEKLGDKLYDMRNAVAHDAVPVFFASSEEQRPKDAATWSITLVDAFTRDRRASFITYQSGLLVEDFISILRNGLWRCFEDG